MNNANYSFVGVGGSGRAGGNTLLVTGPTDTTYSTSSVRTTSVDTGGTPRDVADHLLQLQGDLA